MAIFPSVFVQRTPFVRPKRTKCHDPFLTKILDRKVRVHLSYLAIQVRRMEKGLRKTKYPKHLRLVSTLSQPCFWRKISLRPFPGLPFPFDQIPSCRHQLHLQVYPKKKLKSDATFWRIFWCTLHKHNIWLLGETFFSAFRFLNSVHEYFLN